MDLNLSKVELHFEKNNTEHHTNDISMERLVVRRGQAFLLTLHVGRPFRPTDDFLQITLETGPEPSEASGTRSVFGFPGRLWTKTRWNVEVQESSHSSVTLSVTSPADAIVGAHTLSVRAGSDSSPAVSLGTLLVLFNPWCEDDWVYLPHADERQEYVMNEQGIIYRGAGKYISSLAWDFGQFEDDIIDICLKLLDVNPKCLANPGEDFSARCNPIYVSRVVSAMINSNGDRGVVVGRWDGSYVGGFSPTHWNGSVEILRKWLKYGSHPVKYGQCWVFAGVMCTVLRCLGIPCRIITNYQSAHDTDKSLTIDDFFSDYGVRPKKSHDSVWNYHVWVEAWMKRPDLSGDSLYDGWQVVDPTPQEKSTGVYCCGPSPVKAVLEGHTDLKYDVPFVFAEVNADRVTWMVFADGSKRRIVSDTVTVGQNISTKGIGMDTRLNITSNYKHPEGSKKERVVYKDAVDRGNADSDEDSDPEPKPTKPADISMKIVEVGTPVSGQDIQLSLILRSEHPAPRTLSVNINAQAMRYTGIPDAELCRDVKEILLPANEEVRVPIYIPFSCYGEKMLENNSIKLSVVATDTENAEAVYLAEEDIVPKSPSLTVTVSGTAMQYSQMVAEVLFENPLPQTLRDCSITVTGSGLLRQTEETKLAQLDPGQRVRLQVSFVPYRAGPKKLVADFDCKTFRDIKASCNVDVRPCCSYPWH